MISFNTIIIIQHALISLVGIIGNVLVLVVYKKKLRDKETITFFIVHLAITDLACCLFLIPINCYHELNIGRITSDFMCKFHSFLNIINITYSCLLMTLVAFERCFSIVFPFKRIVTKTRAKWIMAALFAFCFAIALTSCLGIGVYHRVHRFFTLPDNLDNTEVSAALADAEAEAAAASTTATVTYSNQSYVKQLVSPLDTSITNSLRKRQTDSVSEYSMVYDNSTRLKSDKEYSNVTEWMKTNFCFPNNRLIPLHYISYLRIFQNLIVVVCFTTIFVLYALICLRVTRRRQLKADRDLYYKELLDRSKRNTMNTVKFKENNVATAAATEADEAAEAAEAATQVQTPSNVMLVQLPTDVSDPTLSQATIIVATPNNSNTHRVNSDSSLHSAPETNAAADQETCLNLDADNNKSTQTVRSSFTHIKNSHSNSIAINGSKTSPEHHYQKRVNISHVQNYNRNRKSNSFSSSPSNRYYPPSHRHKRHSIHRYHNQKHPDRHRNDSGCLCDKNQQHDQNKNKPAFSYECQSTSMYSQSRYSTALLANLKTAFMLFVVTLIMAIVYTPSLLTSLHIIDYNPIHWNIIYINNAANPIVYSFLNYNFRKNLKNTFKYCCNRLFRRSRHETDFVK